MSNVVKFPSAAPETREMDTGEQQCTAAAFVTDPGESSHAVQFYRDDAALADTVAEFLSAGLRGGDRVVVIATPEHTREFAARLDPLDASHALSTGQLAFLDAEDLLSKLMIGDMPDPDLFKKAIEPLLAPAPDGTPVGRIRAYGEMVDILWRSGNSRAALRLEELWNEVGRAHSFALLCAYVMGNFYREGDAARFMELCRSHTHVLPSASLAQPAQVGEKLCAMDALQRRALSLESEIRQRKELEQALRNALRDRSRVEAQLRSSIKRERESRIEAEASDAFKEVFLGMLGHDLRNPLSTILTTAQLMIMREDVVPEGRKRLERLVNSGKRMQRMIDQILDVTRARVAQGIPVQLGPARDVALLVSKIVEEVRSAHPERSIDLFAREPCWAPLDCDRFEQVVSNLLGNAVAHGDAQRAITVRVDASEGLVRLSVHNFGPPIEQAFLPFLFNPFKQGRQPRSRADGLGLGLYISERIVTAHGGAIHVESSEQAGTRFDVALPSE